jgi:hypothetical protein
MENMGTEQVLILIWTGNDGAFFAVEEHCAGLGFGGGGEDGLHDCGMALVLRKDRI